ncbi:MAG: hypothetical protein RLY57_373 [Candidatus Parcubacteria bacterium]
MQKIIKGKVRQVVSYASPVLRKKAKKLNKMSGVQQLVADLIATCKAAHLVGIAAPQIAVSSQVIIVWQKPTKTRPNLIDTGPKVFVNPRIIEHSVGTEFGYEGCGSLPGIMAKVNRYKAIRIEYIDYISGKKELINLKGFEARIAQHECEHLEGGIFLDNADLSTITTTEEWKKMMKKKKGKK